MIGGPEKFGWMKARERLLQDTPISAEHLAVLALALPRDTLAR